MKQNGNMPVEQEPKPVIILAMMKSSWVNMLGMAKIQVQKLTQSGRKSLIIGGYLIWVEMSGNGVKMDGTKTIKIPQQMEVVGMITILKLKVGYYAAALGSLIRGIVVLRLVSTSVTASITTVFESFPPRIPSPLLFCPLVLCKPNAAKGGSIFFRRDITLLCP